MILNELLADTKNDFDAIYQLLYARGFLLERQEDGITMSDNAAGSTKNYRTGQRP